MKTAEDFKKLIEGFSGDISADNALQVSAIRNGLVVHIYTNIMQQSIFKTAKMVAFIHEGVCGNINEAHGENKNYEEHLESVWEDNVNLLEDEFSLPIQTTAIPSVYLYLSNLFEIKNSLQEMWNKETKTIRITHFKADAQSQVSNCYK